MSCAVRAVSHSDVSCRARRLRGCAPSCGAGSSHTTSHLRSRCTWCVSLVLRASVVVHLLFPLSRAPTSQQFKNAVPCLRRLLVRTLRLLSNTGLSLSCAANLLNALNQLVDALTGLERILTTPIPFSYIFSYRNVLTSHL